MSYKRTIILNANNEKDNKKAIITLQNLNEVCVGEIKLYNFAGINLDNLALGINVNDDVIKVPIEFKENVCNFKTNRYVNIDEKLTCAIVDLSHFKFPEVVVGGTSYNSNNFYQVEAAFYDDVVNPEKLYEPEPQEKIDELINKEMHSELGCDNCSNCKYKDAFYNGATFALSADGAAQSIQTSDDANKKGSISENFAKQKEQSNINTIKINEDIYNSYDTNNSESFYNQIKDQIDDLFKQYISEENLERLIPNSKWTKINYEGEENYYVLGLIYDDEQIKYIAYGIPSKNRTIPPKDLKEYAQWLPLNFDNIDEEGYWIVYQDAASGESIAMDVI